MLHCLVVLFIFAEEKVEVVFHAAAYKHVPLVERNPIQGIYNNVVSTKVLCKVSKTLKINNFILISTDKAVRPTNVMGASKRFAELIVQKYDFDYLSAKLFSIRNIGVDEIQEYINPSLKEHTPDPSILEDMNIAIERVVDGIKKKEKIAGKQKKIGGE